jgi:hypoxanthine-guanine phosphoribosyltransferase
MDEELIKYILKIFIVVIILFGIILLMSFLNSKNQNKQPTTKELKEVVIIEKMTTDTDLKYDNAASFCTNHDNLPSGNTLEESCNKLTNENCNSVSCCVLLNGEKCVAGDADGPTFKTETNGSKRNVDFYYYQKKCYGNGCSSNE